MKRAMEEAGKGSVNAAAKKYGINLSTLQRHIQKGSAEKKLGRYTTVFTKSQEDELLEYVFHMDSLYFGLTKSEFLKLVFQYAEINNIPHTFKNETAGEGWYAGFRSRHPDLSLRCPEPTSIARARGFNKPQVLRFFDLLEEQIVKHNIDATRIYNMDETGIQTSSNRPPRVLSKTGKKQVGVISSVERGKLTTVVCCCNAAGSFVPPFLIFGRKRMVPRLLDGAPPGCVASCTDNGWINGPIFLEWVRHFVSMTRPTPENKIVLVMDNHESHKYLEALDFASKNNIIFVSLPPHTTHRLQPLDTCVYGPFKNYFEQAISLFQRTHVGRIISQYDVAKLFGEAYIKAASAHNAIKGFASTGIWPTNRHIFDDSDYMASSMTDRPAPLTDNDPELVTNQPDISVVDNEHIEMSLPCNANIRSSLDSNRTVSPSVLDLYMDSQLSNLDLALMEEYETVPQPLDKAVSPSHTPTPVGQFIEEPLTPSKNITAGGQMFNDLLTPCNTPSRSTDLQTQDLHKTPIEIRPLPQLVPQKTNRGRRKPQRAEVLTSTPVKQEQREKEMKRKGASATTRTNSKEKKIKQPKASTSTKTQARPKRGPKYKNADVEYRCLICSELYTHPPIEDWIRCDDCYMWAHEACTTYSGRGSYYCDSCQE
ncbi:uncharacterized protein LOC124640306 [Helicoverpa zea]|uniref:uncharacterized protein LOC124640306 n=1 Tax=Helicoverpa zea TaxID=7113 RepID=UPI001F590B17|nr:uncharacterized protein LOC124640306 [Helicoverpa zea]